MIYGPCGEENSTIGVVEQMRWRGPAGGTERLGRAVPRPQGEPGVPLEICKHICKYMLCIYSCMPMFRDEQKHNLRKQRVDYRALHFGVRRSLSLAHETGTEHRTRSTCMMYHTSFSSTMGLDRTRAVETLKILSKIRSETN